MALEHDATEGEETESVLADSAAEEAMAESTDLVELASEMGWSPKDKWRGDPEKWKPAKDFIRTTGEISRNLGKTVKEMRADMTRMTRMTEEGITRARQQERSKIEAEFDAAVEAGDVNKARRLTREMEQATAPEGGDVVAAFKRENPWFGKDEDATAYAVSISQREANKGATPAAQAEAAQKAVRKRFPELFDDDTEEPPAPTARKRPPTLSAPTTRTAEPTKREKGASDLPVEARKAAAEFVRLGVYKSEADYAKSYWRDNA